MSIHVFRYVGGYGDGLVFVDDDNLHRYKEKGEWKYMGTLTQFVKKIRAEVEEKGEAAFYCVE